MRFEKPVPVSWIAEFIGAKLIGNKQGNATGINEIHKVEQGDVVFVDHPKYYDATDALAVALCHFYQLHSIIGKSENLLKGWDNFIKNNPTRIKRK